MKIQNINNSNNSKFGTKFRLSEKTLKCISESTKLSVDELHNLPLDEASKLMKERGALKEPSKLWTWMCKKYKNFGEQTGLLKKPRVIYTHDKIIYM